MIISIFNYSDLVTRAELKIFTTYRLIDYFLIGLRDQAAQLLSTKIELEDAIESAKH